MPASRDSSASFSLASASLASISASAFLLISSGTPRDSRHFVKAGLGGVDDLVGLTLQFCNSGLALLLHCGRLLD